MVDLHRIAGALVAGSVALGVGCAAEPDSEPGLRRGASDAGAEPPGVAASDGGGAPRDGGPIDAGREVDIEGPPVQPHVQLFANEACRAVEACRATTREDHSPSADLALDFPISEAYGKLPTDDYAFGDTVAAFAISDMTKYRIEYVIFRKRINTGSGWKAMEDRGSITANHLDHVHVSFLP